MKKPDLVVSVQTMTQPQCGICESREGAEAEFDGEEGEEEGHPAAILHTLITGKRRAAADTAPPPQSPHPRPKADRPTD